MAGSVNKVILVGRAVRDPEIRTTQSGMKVASLSIATSENWTDKASGEKKERSEFHRVSILNERIADVAERFVRKGKQVFVEGSLQTRKYTDKSGNERTTTEIVVDRFRGDLTLLDSGRDGDTIEDVSRRAPAAQTAAPVGRPGQPQRRPGMCRRSRPSDQPAMRIATVGSKVILQRAIGGFPAATICDVVGRELHDDQRGLSFVLKPRTGGGPITFDEAGLVEGGLPFVLLNYYL